jgi:hypothetical protein
MCADEARVAKSVPCPSLAKFPSSNSNIPISILIGGPLGSVKIPRHALIAHAWIPWLWREKMATPENPSDGNPARLCQIQRAVPMLTQFVVERAPRGAKCPRAQADQSERKMLEALTIISSTCPVPA